MIYYRKGEWKYQLTQDYRCATPITGNVVDQEYYSLDLDGTLTIRRGYAWDGATWAPDFKPAMRPSLGHDAFCQMLNRRQIPFSRETQRAVHDFFKVQLLEAGMYGWLAAIYHRGPILADAGNPENWESDETVFSAP